MGINEVSAMCRGVMMSSRGENRPTNKECDNELDSASEAFHPADTLDRSIFIVAQPTPTIVSISDPERDGLRGPPHSACHIVVALSLASCFCGSWGNEPHQNLKISGFATLTS
jgi:hypothetical protein